MYFIYWLVVLVEVLTAEVLDSVEMGDYCYSGILFAVLFQQLFDFACTETNIQRLLLHVLSVHKVHYAFCFLVVVFTLNFRKELEVLCLILQ